MVKSWTSPKTEIRNSKTDGVGMFAKENIKKDEIVAIKGGHILHRNEMYTSSPINSYYPIDDDIVLAARTREEESKIKIYWNHSCNPNCGIRGEITAVAIRDIKKGEEITIDYAFIDNEENEFKCNCGSKNCRKTVTGYDWKRKDLQEKYGEYFAEYLKRKFRK